jgi:serine/threonine-protein kinase
MTAGRWRRLQELFDQASALAPTARTRYLDTACSDDPSLRRQVESLIAHAETDAGLVDAAIVDAARAAAAAAGAPAVGDRVGAYRIISPLGQGGMGAVYRAVRADEYRKEVAVKLLRGGLASAELLARFRSERQILAQLEHPSIARLLDGGTREDGSPFLVMELVDGEPITDYCDRRRLGVAERLQLFRTVCAAVHYAHQNLVIHRDLKPSNVLVAQDGTPKLLDFGIAKLLRPDAADHTLAVTQPAVRLMTPDYASPEQVRGETVTTASDVYSLGVVLYELLTGRRPHRFEALGQGDLERQVTERQPVRPSTAVLRADEVRTADGERATLAPQTVAERRATTAERLRRQLAGDLDTIVLKAMHKEPARRYASAEQLAEDLGRHLAGLPVVARPDSWRYRAGKFIGRHRLGAALAAGAAVVLAGFAVAMAVLAARLAGERNRAVAAEQQARQVSTFLTDLFRVSDPREARGREVTAREILDRGASRIDTELADQPEVRATLMETIGTVYRQLALFDRAQELFERSLEIRRRVLGPEHPRTADSLNAVGEIHREQSRLPLAESAHRQALEVRRKVLAPDDPAIAESLNNLGLVLQARGQHADAERLFRESLDRRRRVLGEDHAQSIVSRTNLARLLQAMGRAREAEAIQRDVVARRRKVLGADHPDLANALNGLAQMIQGQGRYREAEPLFREAFDIRLRVLGPEHNAVGQTLNDLAALLHDKGDLAGAERLYRRSHEIKVKAVGPEHLDIAIDLNNQATLLEDRGDLAGAVELYRRSLEIRRKRLGDEHPSVARVLHNLGRALVSQGRSREGEGLLRQSLELRRRLLGTDHPEVGGGLASLARARRQAGDRAEAERLYRESLELRRKKLRAGHPQIADSLVGLGLVLAETGRAAEAEVVIQEALAALTPTFPEGHWQVDWAGYALGVAVAAQGRVAEAEARLTAGAAGLRSKLGGASPRAREAVAALARLRGSSSIR